MGNPHQAEDLVQIALAKAYVAWGRIKRDGNVDGYVRRIILNAHIDETRRPWRRERPGIEHLDVAADAGLDLEESDGVGGAWVVDGERNAAVLLAAPPRANVDYGPIDDLCADAAVESVHCVRKVVDGLQVEIAEGKPGFDSYRGYRVFCWARNSSSTSTSYPSPDRRPLTCRATNWPRSPPTHVGSGN